MGNFLSICDRSNFETPENDKKIIEDKKLEDQEEISNQYPIEDKVIIIHNIVNGDSLDSISFQYGVQKALIKKENGLTNDHIYFIKELKIPNPVIGDSASECVIQKTREQQIFEDQQTKILALRRRLKYDYQDESLASHFLIDSDWDYDKCVEDYEKRKQQVLSKKEKYETLMRKFDKKDRYKEMILHYLEEADYDVNKAYEEYCIERDVCLGRKTINNMIELVNASWEGKVKTD